jgi:hypothetical protein
MTVGSLKKKIMVQSGLGKFETVLVDTCGLCL